MFKRNKTTIVIFLLASWPLCCVTAQVRETKYVGIRKIAQMQFLPNKQPTQSAKRLYPLLNDFREANIQYLKTKSYEAKCKVLADYSSRLEKSLGISLPPFFKKTIETPRDRKDRIFFFSQTNISKGEIEKLLSGVKRARNDFGQIKLKMNNDQLVISKNEGEKKHEYAVSNISMNERFGTATIRGKEHRFTDVKVHVDSNSLFLTFVDSSQCYYPVVSADLMTKKINWVAIVRDDLAGNPVEGNGTESHSVEIVTNKSKVFVFETYCWEVSIHVFDKKSGKQVDCFSSYMFDFD